jgi:hypothetical protein
MATIAERLRDAPVGRDNYVGWLGDLLDDADGADVDDTTFAEAFRFIERNAHADLGTPGPLIHFLERFYPRYCDCLVESARRCPTSYTVWMLNRILNGSPSEREHSELLGLLASVAGNPDADPEIRSQARRFWERHAQAR